MFLQLINFHQINVCDKTFWTFNTIERGRQTCPRPIQSKLTDQIFLKFRFTSGCQKKFCIGVYFVCVGSVVDFLYGKIQYHIFRIILLAALGPTIPEFFLNS